MKNTTLALVVRNLPSGGGGKRSAGRPPAVWIRKTSSCGLDWTDPRLDQDPREIKVFEETQSLTLDLQMPDGVCSLRRKCEIVACVSKLRRLESSKFTLRRRGNEICKTSSCSLRDQGLRRDPVSHLDLQMPDGVCSLKTEEES